ncbi:MAG TPA: hypothetical protein VGQ57_10320, partial [Polyangiaceae bacterium]|nr:hypothetical protein [Polyangiaceae bacterium]
HAAIGVSVWQWAVRHPPARVVVPRALLAGRDELEIEVSEPPPLAGSLAGAERSALDGARGRELPAAGARRGGRHAVAPTLQAEPESMPEETPATMTVPATPTAEVATGNGRAIDLGLGPDAWQRWVSLAPRAPAPSAPSPRGTPLVRAPPISSTGGLQEGLDAHDRALGLGPAGRVASALYQAAHTPDAPETGTALFHVTVLKSGGVEVSLGETSDKRWKAVAARAADELRRSPPRIPPPHEGYRLTLKITAEETMPNGLKRKQLRGAHIEGVAPRFHDVKAEQREIELKNPTAGVGPDRQDVRGSPVIIDMPGIFVAGQGKACGYRVGITPFGLLLQGGCDPTNAGSKFQRVVRTEVREETAF